MNLLFSQFEKYSNIIEMTHHSSYVYSSYSPLINLPIDELLQIGNNQNENSTPIPSFDEDLLVNLCLDAEKIFEKEDNILKIDGDVFVVGDIHGNFHDLLRILHYIQLIPSTVLFLGDYVDRGEFSLECITLLFALKIEFPDKFFLIRGNHEFDNICSQYGFKDEILNYHNPSRTRYHKLDYEFQSSIKPYSSYCIYKEDENFVPTEILCDAYFANHININCHKYTEKLYQSFIKAFSYLPLAALINKTTFCVHGGLSPQLDKIHKIERSIQRPIHEYETNQLLADLLWGDPCEKMKFTFDDNPRGCGKMFNCAALIQFLKSNDLCRLLRGHECVNNGIQSKFNEKIVTIFSSSSYNYEMGNMCGIVKIFKNKDDFESIRFPPIRRLHKCDANYYKVEVFDESCQLKNDFTKWPKAKFENLDSEEVNTNKGSPLNFKTIYSLRRTSFNTGIQYKASMASLVVPKKNQTCINFMHKEQGNIIKGVVSPVKNVNAPLRKKSSF